MKKVIFNLILVNGPSKEVLDIKKYNKNIDNKYTFLDLTNDISKNKFFGGIECISFELDEETLSILIATDGQKTGKIKWNVDLYKLKIVRFCELLNRDYVSLYIYEGGYGGVGEAISFFQFIINLYKNISSAIYITEKQAYEYMEENYFVKKEMVQNVIIKFSKWKVSLFDNECKICKPLVENKIMIKLGYKKIGNFWNR